MAQTLDKKHLSSRILGGAFKLSPAVLYVLNQSKKPASSYSKTDFVYKLSRNFSAAPKFSA